MGIVDWPHPENYGVPQFLEAMQSGQNLIELGTYGTPHIAIFSGSDPPLLKERAPTINGLLKSTVCGLVIQKRFSRKG